MLIIIGSHYLLILRSYFLRVYRQLKREDMPYREVDFGNMTKQLQRDYLDMLEGV